MSDTSDKDYNEPAETREDLARQTAEAERIRQAEANVPAAGADALVESAVEKRSAEETNAAIEEARAPAQAEVDKMRAEREGVTETVGVTGVSATGAGDDYDSRTKEQLQDDLRSAGLSTTGNKDELAARLRDHEASSR